ncbi:MAG: copper chaperone PCu(A)C [Hyphomicrobiaceae bacterium]
MSSHLSTLRTLVRATAAACALCIVTALPAAAADYSVGQIKISTPWSRATPAAAKVAGGFMTIENTGKESDFLIGGSLVRSGRVEIHEMAVEKDVMKMRELPNGLEIKPGEKVTLKPGSFHVMFMELKEPLKEGDSVEGTLVFKTAGTVTVKYAVGALATKSGGHGGHGGKH